MAKTLKKILSPIPERIHWLESINKDKIRTACGRFEWELKPNAKGILDPNRIPRYPVTCIGCLAAMAEQQYDHIPEGDLRNAYTIDPVVHFCLDHFTHGVCSYEKALEMAVVELWKEKTRLGELLYVSLIVKPDITVNENII